MRKVFGIVILLAVATLGQAQNIELRAHKDLTQPGLVNPALAGLQESFFRLLTKGNLGNYSFMLEGKVPFHSGNYMIGYERISNEDVGDNMFNITYNKVFKKATGLTLRLGGALEVHSRSLKADASNAALRFTDLNGKETYYSSPQQLVGDLNYFNFNIGASGSYKELFFSASANNLFRPSVSLVDSIDRRLPLSGSFVLGGFLNLGQNMIFFPNLTAYIQPDEIYSKIELAFHSKYFNLSGGYIQDKLGKDLSIGLASKYKSTFFGIRYDQPLEGANTIGDIRVFLNSSILGDLARDRSKLAEAIKHFY